MNPIEQAGMAVLIRAACDADATGRPGWPRAARHRLVVDPRTLKITVKPEENR